jgi:peptidoglycan/LPS O-acetylase OafA/YrhL
LAVCPPAGSAITSASAGGARLIARGPATGAGFARYDSLDFWRGVACLAVVLYHAVLLHLSTPGIAPTWVVSGILAWFGQLSAGVHMFFVISGYCIAAAADRSRASPRGLASYFYRRFRRIYPPLWFAIGLAILVFLIVDVMALPRSLSSHPWIQPRPWWYSGWQWFGNITLTESWRHHLAGDARAHFPGQAWTLCYEEQFYAVMGLLLLAPRFLFRGAAIVSLATIGLVAAAPAMDWDLSGFFFDGSWLNFAAGVLVYYVLRHAGPRARRLSVACLVLGAFAGPWLSVPGGAVGFVFAVLLLWLHPFDREMATSRLLWPITWCGEMCYSLYLVHQLLVKSVAASLAAAGLISPLSTLLLTVPLSILVSVVVGRSFHVLIERRFMNTVRATAATR